MGIGAAQFESSLSSRPKTGDHADLTTCRLCGQLYCAQDHRSDICVVCLRTLVRDGGRALTAEQVAAARELRPWVRRGCRKGARARTARTASIRRANYDEDLATAAARRAGAMRSRSKAAFFATKSNLSCQPLIGATRIHPSPAAAWRHRWARQDTAASTAASLTINPREKQPSSEDEFRTRRAPSMLVPFRFEASEAQAGSRTG